MAKELKVGDKCVYDFTEDEGGSECNHGRQCEIVDVRDGEWIYKYLIRWEGGEEEPVKKESLTKIKKSKTTETMEAQQPTTTTISVSDLKKIHDVACSAWKKKIAEMVQPFQDEVILTKSQVDEMFSAASVSQTVVLEEVFGKQNIIELFYFGDKHMTTASTTTTESPMHIRKAFATEANRCKEIGFNNGFIPVIVIDGEEIELKTGENGAYLKFKIK